MIKFKSTKVGNATTKKWGHQVLIRVELEGLTDEQIDRVEEIFSELSKRRLVYEYERFGDVYFGQSKRNEINWAMQAFLKENHKHQILEIDESGYKDRVKVPEGLYKVGEKIQGREIESFGNSWRPSQRPSQRDREHGCVEFIQYAYLKDV